jgi:hypothetical protein
MLIVENSTIHSICFACQVSGFSLLVLLYTFFCSFRVDFFVVNAGQPHCGRIINAGLTQSGRIDNALSVCCWHVATLPKEDMLQCEQEA